MPSVDPRIAELLEEIRRGSEIISSRRPGAAESSETEAELESRDDTERYYRERAEELLDALSPQDRRDQGEAAVSAAEAGAGGLAVMVGHSRRSCGAFALSPPFPPGSGREEYHWNSELALQIKTLADRFGIRCEIFKRDGYDIPGAYGPVKNWRPSATLELHFNADGPGTRGTETWYSHERSRSWAALLQAKMVKLYERRGGADRGIKDARSIPPHRALTSTSQIHPSALIEPFFCSNLDECKMAMELKPGLARAVIEAYADLASIQLPSGDGVVGPTPEPTPVSPVGPLPGTPETKLFADLRDIYLEPETEIEFPTLKIVTLAQWANESGWGSSGLATAHYNFAGMKARSEIAGLVGGPAGLATVVDYQAHDGWDKYLRFATLDNFIKGYWRFLERSPYRGWKQHTGSERDFISFIAPTWAPADRQYVAKVLDIAGRLRAALASDGADGGAGGLSSAAIPNDAPEFRALFDLVQSSDFPYPNLRGAFLAQCANESNWGRSILARWHFNFAGIEWRDELAEFAAPVDYQPSNGPPRKFCRFADYPNFIMAYFARLDREKAANGTAIFEGWKATVDDPQAFIKFVGPRLHPDNAGYVDSVLGILRRLLAQGAGPGVPSPGGGAVPPGQLPDGYVIRVRRTKTEKRNGHVRTVGNYEVFFRGQKVPGLEGMVLEAHGPGDNKETGKRYKRRVEAKTYPLGTHRSGEGGKYATYGYTADTGRSARPHPAIRLDGTGHRQGILFHPGGGFLASVGCLNFSKPLAGPSSNIDYGDSRDRVIAVIDNMKERLGTLFPAGNWMPIPNAWMVIEGEPGEDQELADSFSGILSKAIGPAERLAAALEAATLSAISAADPFRLYEVAAATMNGSLPEGPSVGVVKALADGGADLKALRNGYGENLWSAWSDGVEAAAAMTDADAQAEARQELTAISALLKSSGVPLDDTSGLHTALVGAAIANQRAAISELLAAGAKIDLPDKLGMTPLIAAAFFGSPDAVDILLAKGADRNVKYSPPVAGDADAETYAELPVAGSTAVEAAGLGRSLVYYEHERDETYQRIVSALARG